MLGSWAFGSSGGELDENLADGGGVKVGSTYICENHFKGIRITIRVTGGQIRYQETKRFQGGRGCKYGFFPLGAHLSAHSARSGQPRAIAPFIGIYPFKFEGPFSSNFISSLKIF